MAEPIRVALPVPTCVGEIARVKLDGAVLPGKAESLVFVAFEHNGELRWFQADDGAGKITSAPSALTGYADGYDPGGAPRLNFSARGVLLGPCISCGEYRTFRDGKLDPHEQNQPAVCRVTSQPCQINHVKEPT